MAQGCDGGHEARRLERERDAPFANALGHMVMRFQLLASKIQLRLSIAALKSSQAVTATFLRSRATTM